MRETCSEMSFLLVVTVVLPCFVDVSLGIDVCYRGSGSYKFCYDTPCCGTDCCKATTVRSIVTLPPWFPSVSTGAMSGGTIAGIVIGCLILVALIIGIVLVVVFCNKRNTANTSYKEGVVHYSPYPGTAVVAQTGIPGAVNNAPVGQGYSPQKQAQGQGDPLQNSGGLGQIQGLGQGYFPQSSVALAQGQVQDYPPQSSVVLGQGQSYPPQSEVGHGQEQCQAQGYPPESSVGTDQDRDVPLKGDD